jgi:hypothetical protein
LILQAFLCYCQRLAGGLEFNYRLNHNNGLILKVTFKFG